MFFSVEKVSSTCKTIIFKLSFAEPPQTRSNIEIIINKNLKFSKALSSKKTELLEKIDEFNISFPFPQYINLSDLDSKSLYKVKFIYNDLNQKYIVNMHASTLSDYNENLDEIVNKQIQKTNFFPNYQGLSSSENSLYTFIEKENNKDSKKKEILANILHARKTKDINTFVNSNYKFSKPPNLREIKKKRLLMVTQGLELYDEVYQLKKKNNEIKLMNNEWFLGPFYIDDKFFKKFL